MPIFYAFLTLIAVILIVSFFHHKSNDNQKLKRSSYMIIENPPITQDKSTPEPAITRREPLTLIEA